jgi:hypothetical protein
MTDASTIVPHYASKRVPKYASIFFWRALFWRAVTRKTRLLTSAWKSCQCATTILATVSPALEKRRRCPFRRCFSIE